MKTSEHDIEDERRRRVDAEKRVSEYEKRISEMAGGIRPSVDRSHKRSASMGRVSDEVVIKF